MINSSTGTSIESYLNWVKKELEKKDYGEVSITFTVTRGEISDVRKESVDRDHFQLTKKN